VLLRAYDVAAAPILLKKMNESSRVTYQYI
jgi:hypothetical protein